MNTNKIALMAIAVVAIGIFALPSTVSLLSGQHTWYDLVDDAESQVPCDKCHKDIDDEMMSPDNGVHKTLNATGGCLCHRVSDTRIKTGVAIGGDTQPNFTVGTSSHAAETIACMICHENGTNYPFAGGFNQSAVNASSGGVNTIYYYEENGAATGAGQHAAHNQFIGQAIHDPLMEDSNEACIACHTRVGVNISWTKNENLVFTASEDKNGTWNVSGFEATGSNTTNITYANDWTT